MPKALFAISVFASVAVGAVAAVHCAAERAGPPLKVCLATAAVTSYLVGLVGFSDFIVPLAWAVSGSVVLSCEAFLA